MAVRRLRCAQLQVAAVSALRDLGAAAFFLGAMLAVYAFERWQGRR